MMRFTRFLKVEADVVIGRHSLISDETKAKIEPIIFLHPDFAKRSGIKEGDVVEVERKGRNVKLKVKFLEEAPENGGLIPNGIFASYLADSENFKRIKVTVEVSEGEPTKVEEIIEKMKG